MQQIGRTSRICLVFALFASFAACGGGEGTTEPPVPTGAKLGTFRLELKGPADNMAGMTQLIGKVADAPAPEAIAYVTTASEKECRLIEPRVPFCDPPCTGGSVCVSDRRCVGEPMARNVGTVKVTGLRSASGPVEITMTPMPPKYVYQPPIDVILAYPPAAEGGDIRLSASGADVPAFQIGAKSIAPLELTGPLPIPVESGRPLPVSWKAGKAGVGRVQLVVDVSHHGGLKGKIECEVADSGSYSVPASLVTKLLALGLAGFPVVRVNRSAAGAASVSGGHVELNVIEEVERALSIPGVLSCFEDADCPAPKKCAPNLSCQ
jgi:hypothetical protein